MAKISIMGCATDTDELERVIAETEAGLAADKRKQRFGGKLTPAAIADIWARWRGEGVYARPAKGTLKQ
jgi:hypothetical protein